MSNFPIKTVFAFALFAPISAFAAVASINDAIDLGINFFASLMPIMLGLAVVVFFWGIVKFIYNAGDEKSVAEGKMIMVWGVVGIGVIALLWGIIGYLQQSLGLNVTGTVGNSPQIPTSIPMT